MTDAGDRPAEEREGLLDRLRRYSTARPKSEDLRTVELIATVSHEIRSPLTTIKGFTKTLLDRWDRLSDETKRDMLQAINADADRVTRLLTELLDVSRLEAGKLTLHRRPVDLRELAERAVNDLGRRSEHHVVQLVEGESVVVLGDPDKLTQVVTNFIENAQKYTEAGTITVACTRADDSGRVAVSDEGHGISEPGLTGLFEKFSRPNVPGSPSGTGLGLYICKGLVEAHGGDIGVTSQASAGSTFWFRIPLADV